jgi:hypothetical protein
MSNANFAPHENAPGPRRLHMEVADGSGQVNADIQYIADRQAIAGGRHPSLMSVSSSA